ncbi:LPS-assembly protein LptD [Aliikangiella maris]|uniref:LPS-assembly protein LptD n=2 Tax=Aliikangiella maris TaxID=3162458 RepID=A0ABV3MLW0_9GAMM
MKKIIKLIFRQVYSKQIHIKQVHAKLLVGMLLYCGILHPGAAINATESSAKSSDATAEVNLNDTDFPYFQSRFVELPADFSSFGQCQSNNSVNSSVIFDSSMPKPQPRREIPNSLLLQDDNKNIQRFTKILADSVPQMGNGQSVFKGNLKIINADYLIRTQEIQIDHQRQQTIAKSGVSLESFNTLFVADSLIKSDKNQSITINDARFYLFSNQANGQADTIYAVPGETIELKELTFSTCPVNNQSWQLSTGEMVINQEEGRGQAWHSVLKIEDFPVFYFPYVSFPIDDRRKSGLLSPRFKMSDDDGLDYAQPIYWNIAPWIDATFLPRYIEKRGEQLGTEVRWLTQRFESDLYLEWMEQDRLYDTASITKSEERWLGRINSKARFNSNWSLQMSAKRVSDDDYLRDFSSGLGLANQTRLTSQLNLAYQDEIWQMNWFLLTHQSLIGDESYRYLPSWQISADHLSDNGIRWQLDSEITQFSHKDVKQIEGIRAHLSPTISYPMQQSWGYLIPKVAFQASRYEQQDQLTDDKQTLSRHLPVVSLDSGIYLDRHYTMGESHYTYALEPRLKYTYIPYRNQQAINVFDTTLPDFTLYQLWQENRYSGIDRIGDTEQLSVALGNRILNNSHGAEIARLTLGRIYYLADRKAQLANGFIQTEQQSPWLAELEYQIGATLSLRSQVQWDDTTNQTQRAQIQINFEPKDNQIVNLTHRYRDVDGKTNEELDLSFAWPINDKWRILGRWYSDLEQDQTIERLFGVEYSSCCWAIRLVSQKYLNTQLDAMGTPTLVDRARYNDGIHLQFVFKGLGSTGQSGLQEVIADSIPGYQDPFLSR